MYSVPGSVVQTSAVSYSEVRSVGHLGAVSYSVEHTSAVSYSVVCREGIVSKDM